MSISIAEYLVHHAVRTATGLQQQTKDGNNHTTIKAQRDKPNQRIEENKRVSTPTSAYRVTISPAAMQKMAASSNSM